MPANKQSPPKMAQNFPIVGIGASAGGLEAFKKIVEAIDEYSGMAYVLVQHLAPKHESILPDILSRFTIVPVHEITDDINLAPDHIYIIPENKILTTKDGVLKLAPRDLSDKKNRPIDVFFRSLAEVHKSFAIGVVLSGSGFDGTEGLKVIKEMGGITYAQSPESAAFDAMPIHAINSGSVDFVLNPEEIPQHLQHVKKAYKINHAYADNLELPHDDEDIFKQILRQIRLRSGSDFSQYKQPTLRRRIARRMVMTKNESPEQYLNFLRSDPKEIDALFNDVLIPVSYFFRDPEIFEVLKNTVFPLLLKNKDQGESIRIWVAGCSTGEEAYSLAISLHEFLSEEAPDVRVQIFASDISEKMISKARTAIFGKEDLVNVSEKRLKKYFTKIEGGYHINKIIRDMVVFAVHNLLKDPPFAKMDLISCRNVLIYFNPFLQKKALTTFHYSLKKNGFLFLGKTESVSIVQKLFEPIHKNQKIYYRKAVSSRFIAVGFEPQEITSQITKKYVPSKKIETQPDFQKLAESILFNKYTPAGVIIDHHKDIIHFHGNTSPFLAPAPGKPNLNVIKMAKEGLGFELRNALVKSKANEKTVKKGIKIKGENYLVDLEVIPLITDLDPHYLVLFHKWEIEGIEEKAKLRNDSDQKRIKILEAELEQLREDIRIVTEDQEAVVEELQSANEELLSSSEEMQSLNEELETSSEELQSNNEELISVNEELLDRQDQLIRARQNAEAIVETIRDPFVILDGNLRVKKANKAFYDYFKTKEEDTEGHSIFELNNRQWNIPALRHLLEKLLKEKIKIDDFEITGNFPNKGEHSLLISARQILNGKHSDELILMVFEDITEKKADKIKKESEEYFRVMADTAPVLLWIADADGKISFLNQSWLSFTGRTMDQELGMGWIQGIHQEDLKKTIALYKKKFKEKEKFQMEYRLQNKEGEYRWISVKGVPRFSPQGDFMGYVGGCIDIHEQKNFSEALEHKVTYRTKELLESKTFLQLILDMTQNIIYVYDFSKEKIVFVNSKITESTGINPDDITKLETDIFVPIVHPDDLEKVKGQHFAMQNSRNNEIVSVEYRLKNLQGEWAYHLSRAVVFMRDQNGVPVQYMGVSTDITDLKKASELLLDRNRELQRSNVELASFSSIASHDLKEPLRKIQIFLKLIAEADKETLSEVSKGYLNRVVLSANRMQHLIDDLISYSRTSSQKVNFVETDLNQLLQDVIEDLGEIIKDQNVIIKTGDLPTMPVIPSQFRQLFMNLIGNAIKYRKKEVNPRIIIKSSVTDSDILKNKNGGISKKYHKITVSDNGIGFSNEHKSRIFEPFQRLHGKDEYSGTGIGLAICKKIVENHYGFITAESKEGKGSSFCIFIPFTN